MARRTWLVIAGVASVGVVVALGFGAATASGDITGPPVMTAAPVVKGPPGIGKTLRTDDGSWSTSATFTYQWVRCSATYDDCQDIPGATAATYVAVAADVGRVLGASVTATNAAGSASGLSTGMGPVADAPPGTKHRPSIAGTRKVGWRIREAADRWSGFPYRFTSHWLRCSAAGNACVRITGKRLRCWHGSCVRVDLGTQWDYLLTKKDVGHRIRVRVAAWNGVGHATSISAATRVVTK